MYKRQEILQNKGKVTAAIAKAFAESEFEQYRVIQDQLYQSDFDRLVEMCIRDRNSRPRTHFMGCLSKNC